MGVEVTVVQQGSSLPAGVRMWSVILVRLVLWQLGASMGVEVTAVQFGSSLPPEYHMGSAVMELLLLSELAVLSVRGAKVDVEEDGKLIRP